MVKKYRESKGLSHKKLGKLLGVDASTISNLEEDKSKPRPKTIVKLENLLLKTQ